MAINKEIYQISPKEKETFSNPVSNPDGEILAVISTLDKENYATENSIKFFDAKTGKLIDSLKKDFEEIPDFVFSPDKKTHLQK